MMLNLPIKDEAAMLALGGCLASNCLPPCIVFLQGELGMGKTTLVRGFLHGIGHKGLVKSPTYTLVEPYEISGKQVHHFDLYRVADPLELDHIGIQDYFTEQSICLIEWPERGLSLLPKPDLTCYILAQGEGRVVRLTADTQQGQQLLNKIG